MRLMVDCSESALHAVRVALISGFVVCTSGYYKVSRNRVFGSPNDVPWLCVHISRFIPYRAFSGINMVDVLGVIEVELREFDSHNRACNISH